MIAGMVLADETIEGRLVILRGAARRILQPGIELGLKRIDVPTGEIVPDALDEGCRERPLAEERQGRG